MTKRRETSVQLSFGFSDASEMERVQIEYNRLKSKNDQLKAENAILVAENKWLKELLLIFTAEDSSNHSDSTIIAASETEPVAILSNGEIVTKQSIIEQKITLYRHYFKGREDVYAVRGT